MKTYRITPAIVRTVQQKLDARFGKKAIHALALLLLCSCLSLVSCKNDKVPEQSEQSPPKNLKTQEIPPRQSADGKITITDTRQRSTIEKAIKDKELLPGAYIVDAFFAENKTPPFKRLQKSALGEAVYIIVDTLNLVGREVTVNILDVKKIITAEEYDVLSFQQDEKDVNGLLKATVQENGYAVFTVRLQPGKDNEENKTLESWRNKIGAAPYKRLYLGLLVSVKAEANETIMYCGSNPAHNPGDKSESNYWLDMEGKWLEVRRKNPVIVLDAGHGGDDPGVTKYKLARNEADITLMTVNYIKTSLLSGGIKSENLVLTRDTDINPGGSGQKKSLNVRVRISKEHHADLFIAIHVNSGATATTVNENADYVRVYSKIGSNPLSVSLREYIVISLRNVVTSKQGVSGTEESHHVTREQAAQVGGTLVEIGFITNNAQETLMNSDTYLENVGNSIGHAILQTTDEYF